MKMNIRNPNDIMTDDIALGPSQVGDVVSTPTSYHKPGLPPPPGGWNRNLGTDVKFPAKAHTKVIADGSN